ncbi:hypothetical protein [Onishia taeanensis]
MGAPHQNQWSCVQMAFEISLTVFLYYYLAEEGRCLAPKKANQHSHPLRSAQFLASLAPGKTAENRHLSEPLKKKTLTGQPLDHQGRDDIRTLDFGRKKQSSPMPILHKACASL